MLVGLVLLASVLVLLPLVGCDTNAGDTPSNNDTTIQQPADDSGKTELPKYTVRFDKGDNPEYEDKLPSELMVDRGTLLTAKQLESLTGTENYLFTGWYVGETKVEAGEYSVIETVTLIARWTPCLRATQENFTEMLETAMDREGITLVLQEKIDVCDPSITHGNFILDLNSYRLNNRGVYGFSVKEDAILTIKDDSNRGDIEASIINYGKLTINGGSFTGDLLNCGSGELTINGGRINAVGDREVTAVINEGSLTINGGEISVSGDLSTGVKNSGSLTIKGGRISASYFGVYNKKTLKLSGEFENTGHLVDFLLEPDKSGVIEPITLEDELIGDNSYTVGILGEIKEDTPIITWGESYKSSDVISEKFQVWEIFSLEEMYPVSLELDTSKNALVSKKE